MAFIRRVRIEIAAFRLASTRDHVTEIALDCGFGTPEGFNRAFKSTFGCTPCEFRNLNAGREIAFPSCAPQEGLSSTNELDQIGVVTAENAITTFIYDGLRLVGRQSPSTTRQGAS